MRRLTVGAGALGMIAAFVVPQLAMGVGRAGAAISIGSDLDLILSVPGTQTADATGPTGAVVNFSPAPTASDEDGETPSVGCDPASGSTFPIGTTVVTCTAGDSDDITVTRTFDVDVKGAVGQLTDLGTAVNRKGPGTSLEDKVSAIESYLANGDTTDACGTLGAFINEVKAQSRTIGPALATTLVADAQQIEAVIPCTH